MSLIRYEEREAFLSLQVSPEAYQEFEALFLDWLNQNQEEVEAGGSGNYKALMASVVLWAQSNLKPIMPRGGS